MKIFKRFAALTLLLAMALPTAIACGGGNDDKGNKKPQIKTISSELLDGKVANLLSADGIGIEDKSQNSVAPAKKSGGALNVVTASADEGGENTTAKQAKNELVKQTDDGLEDVRFHDGKKGDYRQWNQKFNNHHHRGEECKNPNCDEISDEIEAEEEAENTPTVISLDARVNKLYNAGKFTFMSVSSAVEGEVKVYTHTIRANSTDQLYAYAASGTYPTILNVTEHYKSKEELGSNAFSFMNVTVGDKRGMILVKRSEAETGYHYANYWSDDFNQSYLIDNETGKTYSLSQIPYIYSVQNGLIQVVDMQKSNPSRIFLDFYKPQIVDGALTLNKIQIDAAHENGVYASRPPIVDIYGNIVFPSNIMVEGENQFGEIKGNGYVVAGYSKFVYDEITRASGSPNSHASRQYISANRYQLGNDGRIYRFDYRGDMNKIPVAVLNENCEWTDVPVATDVTFPASAFMVNVSINAALWQYLCPTRIANGKTFFANAC
ncbi:MAG: hypothetical protein IJB97_03760, partial [Clostridia bacterium]|nr:hypothetical protein [Clostridia bacterium]